MSLIVFGCSYVNGTKLYDVINQNVWAFKLNLPPHKVSVIAGSARSNRSIVNSISEQIQEGKLNKDSVVIVHWSHSERQALANRYVDEDNTHIEDYKNLQLNGITLGWNEFTNKELWEALLINGLNEIYLVQELLKDKCKDYFFITTDHYQSYKSTQSKIIDLINKDKIFNWPCELDNMFSVDDQDSFILNWITQSFPLTLCRYLGKEYIHDDFKHLNMKGHTEFGKMIFDWMVDPSKDWNYILNNSTSNQQQVCRDAHKGFIELQKLYKEFPKSVHWVEEIYTSTDLVQQQTGYVYEN